MAEPKVKLRRTILIDFDIIVFQFSYTHEIFVDWQDGTSVTLYRIEQAKYGIMNFIDRLVTRTKATNVVLCATGSFNFRYGVLPSYKHNRADVEKPHLIDDLKAWASTEYEYRTAKGFEADDLMGIYATKEPRNTVIATIDKDLKQIPARLYLWNRGTLEKIKLRDADLWFYRQVLTGDSTDGYGGCPGVGPVKADEILNSTLKRNWWKAIVEVYEETLKKAYVLVVKAAQGEKVPKRDWWTEYIELCEKAGGAQQYALQIARVARICRCTDANPEVTTPILWKPRWYKEVKKADL